MPNLLCDRIETFASSDDLEATLPSSFLLSSDRGGIGIRITSPSFVGFNPISAFKTDFSISSKAVLSKGCMTNSFGSGTDIVANC